MRLTIRRNKGRLEGLVIAICGDVMHSAGRALQHLPAQHHGRPRPRRGALHAAAARIERMGVEVARDMRGD